MTGAPIPRRFVQPAQARRRAAHLTIAGRAVNVRECSFRGGAQSLQYGFVLLHNHFDVWSDGDCLRWEDSVSATASAIPRITSEVARSTSKMLCREAHWTPRPHCGLSVRQVLIPGFVDLLALRSAGWCEKRFSTSRIAFRSIPSRGRACVAAVLPRSHQVIGRVSKACNETLCLRTARAQSTRWSGRRSKSTRSMISRFDCASTEPMQ